MLGEINEAALHEIRFIAIPHVVDLLCVLRVLGFEDRGDVAEVDEDFLHVGFDHVPGYGAVGPCGFAGMRAGGYGLADVGWDI